MIRAVLDAHVLASGIIGFLILTSTPGQILRAWRALQSDLLVSDHLLSELKRTLEKPHFQARLTQERSTQFQHWIANAAVRVPLTAAVSMVATHPEDDLVLATAVSAQADYLVTGDRRLINAVPVYRDVTLTTPREFLEILEASA
jgi:putative PIN family toxin of toxin-antitoxin system